MKSTTKNANKTLIEKLSPTKLRLSPKMRWIIDSVTAQDYGSRGPRGEAPGHLSITSDGYVLHGNMFIGAFQDMLENFKGVLDTIEATPAERSAFSQLVKFNTTDWRS